MKLIKIFATFSLCTTLLAGCSSNSDTTVDIKAITYDIRNDIEFSDELMELKFPTLKDFYNLEESYLSDYKVYISASGSVADEIALFEAKDEAYVDKIKSSVEERIDDLKFSFENYKPEEINKLNNHVLITKGNYVMMCTSDYPDEITKIFQNE